MAMGNWIVGIALKFESNGLVTMQRLASATGAANEQLARQQGLIDRNTAAMMRYQRRIEEIRAKQARMGTMFAGGGALVGGAALAFSVDEAAKLQRAMTGVTLATGANDAQRKMLQAMVLETSGATAQSAVTIANELQKAATVAFKDPNQLKAMFPQMARYADVRYMASGGKTDPTETIEQMSQFAHFFQAYTPEKMKKMLDDTARLQFTTNAQLNQLVTQGKYFIPNAVKMGVDENTIFQYLAVMAQNGFLQGKGGTAMNNLVLNAMAVTPSAELATAKRQGLRDLDLRDKDGSFKYLTKDGQLSLIPMIEHLRTMRELMEKADRRNGGANWLHDIQAVFAKEAQRLVSIVADKTTQEQMTRNQAAFNRIPGVEGQWEAYAKDFFYQWNAFTTNLRNVAAVIALPELPHLTAWLTDLNTRLTNLVGFLAANPDVAKRIFETGVAITGAFGLRFVLGIAGAIGALNRFSGAMESFAAKADLAALATGAGAAGGAGAAKATGGLWGMIDNIIFGGLGSALVTGGAKFASMLNLRIVLPLLGFANNFGSIGTKILAAATDIGAGAATVEGAFAGILSIIGRLGGVASLGLLLTDGGVSQDEASVLRAKYLQSRRDYAKKHGGLGSISDSDAQQIRDQDKVIQSVHLHFPNMVVKDGADFAKKVKGGLQGIGSLVTTPTLANPQTVGAGLFR
jgi:TP901 family phage tail tape measure protein